MSNTVEQLERLPKWAQRRIAMLEMRLDEARGKLAQGPEESDTFSDPYAETPRPLGMGPTVSFVFAKRADGSPLDWVQARIEDDAAGHRRVYVSGSGGIVFCPRASNAAYIELSSQ